MYDFQNKNAVVIGASSGIGAQVAKDLNKSGANVILISRNYKKLDSMAKSFKESHAIYGDISDISNSLKIVEAISSKFYSVDFLVITSGNFKISPINDCSENDWDYIFDTNIKGVFFFIQGLIPLMKKGTGKSIVIVSSILAHFGGYQTSFYSAAKAGLSSLVKSLSVEISKHDIRINAVSPGHIDTPLIAGLLSDAILKEEIINLYPLKRIGTVKDVSPLILFLLSDFASWITGSDYLIDGGRSATI